MLLLIGYPTRTSSIAKGNGASADGGKSTGKSQSKVLRILQLVVCSRNEESIGGATGEFIPIYDTGLTSSWQPNHKIVAAMIQRRRSPVLNSSFLMRVKHTLVVPRVGKVSSL